MSCASIPVFISMGLVGKYLFNSTFCVTLVSASVLCVLTFVYFNQILPICLVFVVNDDDDDDDYLKVLLITLTI